MIDPCLSPAWRRIIAQRRTKHKTWEEEEEEGGKEDTQHRVKHSPMHAHARTHTNVSESQCDK